MKELTGLLFVAKNVVEVIFKRTATINQIGMVAGITIVLGFILTSLLSAIIGSFLTWLIISVATIVFVARTIEEQAKRIYAHILQQLNNEHEK